MTTHKLRFKILSQLITVVIALVFFGIAFIFKSKNDTQMFNVFIGAFLGLLSVGIINILYILLTNKIDFLSHNELLNTISYKMVALLLNEVVMEVGSGSSVFKNIVANTLKNEKKYNKIDILAYSSKGFLDAFNLLQSEENVISCNEMNILLQEINFDNEEIIENWNKLVKDNVVKQINFRKSTKETDKLLYGMILDENYGVIGYYTPANHKILHAFSLDSKEIGHTEMLDVVRKWYSHYVNDSKEYRSLSSDNEKDMGV